MFNRKKVRVKQHDITDCGAACLASVATHFGMNLPIARIRQLSGTDRKGTSVLGMIEAAERLGFIARGVRGKLKSLGQIPIPAIAHVVVKQKLHHYVVIYKVKGKYLWIMDPMDGRIRRLSREQFKERWTGVLILLMPGGAFEKADQEVSLYRRLWYLVRPHKVILLQALFGAAVYTVIGLSTAIYVQLIVDRVIPGQNGNLLNLLSIVMLALLALQVFIGVMKRIFTLKTGQQIDARLILGYYRHLLRLPMRFFDSMRVGEIISRINDAIKIRSFVNEVAVGMAVNVFILLFSFGLMFTYYWKLALVMLTVIPAYAIVFAITNYLNRRTQRKVMEDAAELEAQMVQSLNAMATVKHFGLEEHAGGRAESRFIRLLNSLYQSGLNALFTGQSSRFISQLFTIILLWTGGYFVIRQAITPGELLSFYAIIGYFTGPVSQLLGANRNLQDAFVAADRLFEILDLETETDPEPSESIQPSGDIVFEEVCFTYGAREPVFEGLSLRIPRGKISAFVGESGSGKSTLLKILQKLYPVRSGRVYIGPYNLNLVPRKSLRDTIAVVPQHTELFDGNILENIAVGVMRPDLEKVVRICRQLGLLSFIERLPGGFHNQIGENGAQLSGGQKKRLAIARALYRDPEILVLDEAMASLDSNAVECVDRTLKKLAGRGKTVIMISHRMHTVIEADRIFVLDQGKLAEAGRHEELLKRKGKYYELWNKQLPGCFKKNGVSRSNRIR